MHWIAIIGLGTIAACLAGFAYWNPSFFRRLSETLRNVSLIAGIVLLSWNTAVTATVYALYSAGLLQVSLSDKARAIQNALVLLNAPAVILVFGGAWLYVTALQRVHRARRLADATAF